MNLGERKEIAPGVGFTKVVDPKLKTNNIVVEFINPLTEETAAANAAAAFMIEDTCRKYPTVTAFARRLSELYGAGISTGISRAGDSQIITAAASCIADRFALEGEDITSLTAQLLISCLLDPVLENGSFPEKQFALKKQELIDDINADINDKRRYALKNAGETAFKGEPAGIPVKGSLESAGSLTADGVYAAYRKMLESAEIEIIFAGNAISDGCVSLLEEAFSGIKRGEIYRRPETALSPVKAAPEYVTETLGVVQSKLVMAYKTDIKDYAVSQVFSYAFGRAPFSMLFSNVREKLSLCYYCSSSVILKKGAVMIDSGVESENISACEEEIKRQLSLAQSGSFSEELLPQAKLLLACALKSVCDYPKTIADWVFDCFYEGKDETPEERARLINAVTKEDVINYAASLKLDTVYVLTGKETKE